MSTKTVTIGKFTYELTHMTPEQAFDTYLDCQSLVGLQSGKSVDKARAKSAMKAFAEVTVVKEGTKTLGVLAPIMEQHFLGRFKAQMAWFTFCAENGFEDFSDT